MTNFTDAPVSLNIQVITPQGFLGQITFRGDDWDKIKDAFLIEEKNLMTDGFKPQPVRTFGGPRPEKKIEYVEGRVCPKCKNQLVYFEAKGKKHIKCSTSKYDWKTKTNSGCDFIEWAEQDNAPKETVGNMSGFPDRTSLAQVNLIRKLQGEGRIGKEIDPTKITKTEAKTIISSALQ